MFKKSSNQDSSAGIDLEEVGRFRKLNRTQHRRFLERVFTARELKYCFSKKDPAPHLAVRFCAKEAVIKALADIGIHKVPYCDIEIVNTAHSVPKVTLPLKLKKLHVQVSLSHTKYYAVACVLVTFDSG